MAGPLSCSIRLGNPQTAVPSGSHGNPWQDSSARCPVHCYRPGMREAVREVMRYAGPRMVVRHPVLALRHLLDGRRREPSR